MLKKYTLLAALFTIMFCSCRDYLTDVVDITPPEMSTDKQNYNVNDTVIVTLVNKSASDIYITGAYNTIEKQNSADWDVFAVLSCSGGCPEYRVPGKGSITARVIPLGSRGIFRFTCYFGRKSGTPFEQKIVVYSNEFSFGQ